MIQSKFGIACPSCGGTENAVIDSRPGMIGEIQTIRRRRRCPCGNKFTTAEITDDGISHLRFSSAVTVGRLKEILRAIAAQVETSQQILSEEARGTRFSPTYTSATYKKRSKKDEGL